LSQIPEIKVNFGHLSKLVSIQKDDEGVFTIANEGLQLSVTSPNKRTLVAEIQLWEAVRFILDA
jgi:hypothetical protein